MNRKELDLATTNTANFLSKDFGINNPKNFLEKEIII